MLNRPVLEIQALRVAHQVLVGELDAGEVGNALAAARRKSVMGRFTPVMAGM